MICMPAFSEKRFLMISKARIWSYGNIPMTILNPGSHLRELEIRSDEERPQFSGVRVFGSHKECQGSPSLFGWL